MIVIINIIIMMRGKLGESLLSRTEEESLG